MSEDAAATAAAVAEASAEEAAPAPTGNNQNATPAEMRTITLTGYGGVKMVKIVKKTEIKPKEGEVLIRVKACGLNFGDLILRQGAVDNPPKTPFIMGFECSGEVEALGENTSGFNIGDRVIGVCESSAWAELVAIPSQFVYKMPTGMSFQDGAALSMNYVTAYMMLFEMANLKEGDSVLCHSIGGGVGFAVSQLCRSIPNVTLFGTASYGKHEAIKNDVGHLFDRVVDYCQEIRKVSPEGVDIVLDCLCGDDTNKGIGLLKPLGKYILYGSSNVVTGETKSFFSVAKSWWQVDKINPVKLYEENKSVAGFQLRQFLFKQGRHDYVRGIMDKLFRLYNERKIRPQIDSAWAFEDVRDAMQKLHDRKNIGKVILDPSLEPKAEKQVAESKDNSSNGKEAKKTEEEAGK